MRELGLELMDRIFGPDLSPPPSETRTPTVPHRQDPREKAPASPPPRAEAAPTTAPGEGTPRPAGDANPVHDLDWDGLISAIARCEKCPLHRTRTNTVPGVGDRQADWMFVGEGPGEEEDRKGEPFVGAAGKLLDRMLRAMNMDRTDGTYIANIVKCRPPGNRNPAGEEAHACLPYLERQIALVRPKVIVALGKVAANHLLGNDTPISKLRGRVHEHRGIPLVATYHPAYLLRSERADGKRKVWSDLCLAMREMARHSGRNGTAATPSSPGEARGASGEDRDNRPG